MEKLPFEKLEKSYHEPARLAILSLLINEPDGMTYNELKDTLELTYGNLERHMRVLADAGLVEIEKLSDGGRPKSIAKISREGRDGFLAYLDHLESILEIAQKASSAKDAPSLEGGTEGLVASGI